MADYIKYFLVAAGLFCLIDYLWLGKLAKNFYRSRLGNLIAKKPNLRAAILFYILFIVGLMVFAIVPASRDHHPVTQAFTLGALYGFFTYCTYDLTNLATIKGWPTPVVVVDIAWGAVISSSVAGLTAFLAF